MTSIIENPISIINKYKDKIIKLELELDNNKHIGYQLERKNSQIKELEKRITLLMNEINHIHNAKSEIEHNLTRQLNENTFKSISTLGQLKSDLEIKNIQLGSFPELKNYITTLENLNLNLVDEIKELKQKYEQSNMMEHDNYKQKLKDTNKTFLNLMKSLKVSLYQNSVDHLGNSSKLLVLHNKLLNEELTKQSIIVEELLRKIQKKNKVILELKTDNQISKKLNKSLVFTTKKSEETLRNIINLKNMTGSKHLEISKSESLKLIKPESKNKNSSENVIERKLRKVSSNLKYDLPGFNQDIYSRNTHFNSEIKSSNKNVTSFKELRSKTQIANMNNTEFSNDWFIDRLNTILKNNKITQEMIESIENKSIREIMNLIYFFKKSIKNCEEIKKFSDLQKKSKSILQIYEKYLEDKPINLIKLKII